MSELLQLPGAEVGSLSVLHKAIELHHAGVLDKVMIVSMDPDGVPQLMYATMTMGELALLRLAVDRYIGDVVYRNMK